MTGNQSKYKNSKYKSKYFKYKIKYLIEKHESILENLELVNSIESENNSEIQIK